MKTFFLSATLLAISSLTAGSQVLINRTPSVADGDAEVMIMFHRPSPVFAEGKEPVFTRHQKISGSQDEFELQDLLSRDGGSARNMPAPGFFELGEEWRPLAHDPEHQVYVYTNNPSLDRMTINNAQIGKTGQVEIAAQFFDENGDVISFNFQEGDLARDLRVFQATRDPLTVTKHHQPISRFGLYLLFDRSGSMDNTGKVQTDFLRGLFANLPHNTECGLAFFTTSVKFRNDGAYELCTSMSAMSDQEFIDLTPFGGGTDIYLGLQEVFVKTEQKDHSQRLIVVVTDGMQRSSIKKAGLIQSRPENTKIVAFRPDSYDASTLDGLADFDIVLSQTVRADKDAYRKTLANFSEAIVEVLEGQVFLNATVAPKEQASLKRGGRKK